MRRLLIFLVFLIAIQQANALTLNVQGNVVNKPVTVTTDKPALIIFRMNNGTPIYAYGTSAKFIPHITGKLLIEAVAGEEKAVKIVEIHQPPSSGSSSGGISSNIYWQGTVYLPDGTFTKKATNGKVYTIRWRTALGALEKASEIGGFSYTIKETQWGPFVSCIAGKCEGSEGSTSGWMYWVNYPNEPLPGVSADKYEVHDGDVVYWFFSKSMSDTPDTSDMVIKIYVHYASSSSTSSESGVSTVGGKKTFEKTLTVKAGKSEEIDVNRYNVVKIIIKPKKSGSYTVKVGSAEPKVKPRAIATYAFFNVTVDKPCFATIEFEVSRSWMEDHGFKPNQISLLKFEKYWIELPTKFLKNDSEYYYFESNVSSFSTFAIAVTRWSNFPLNVTDKPIIKALQYLKFVQHSDGGFGENESNFAKTCWVIMALVSAKQNPYKWVKDGNSSVDYLKHEIRKEIDKMGTADLARTILTVIAVGKDPRNFTGIDLVSKLKEKVKPNGQIGDYIYTTIWGIIALKACGVDVSKSVEWLKIHQNADGGFGWTVGAKSDYDDTAAAIVALIEGGVPRNSTVIKRALDYLKTGQNEDGGFRYFGNSASNSASDSWVIWGILASGQNPTEWKKNNVSVVDHLLSLQAEEGYFKYTKYQVSNPCYMTACAIMALLGKYPPVYPSGYVNLTISTPTPKPTPTAVPTPTKPKPTAVTPTATPTATATPNATLSVTPVAAPTKTPTKVTTKPTFRIDGFTAIIGVIGIAIALAVRRT